MGTNRLICLVCYMSLLTQGTVARRRTGQGFNLLFTDNNDVFKNEIVHFSKPPPTWLQGTWIRNGLGLFGVGKRVFNHAFDAFAKLASWKFSGTSKVVFNYEFLKSESYNSSMDSNDIAPYVTLGGTRPPMGFSDRVKAVFRGIDNTNVNIVQLSNTSPNNISDKNKETLAVSDFWKCYSFDPVTLATDQVMDTHVPGANVFSAGIPKPSSAHPLKEFGTNNYITFVSLINPIPWFSSSISLIRIASSKKRELIATWEVSRVPYMHSFALSRRFAVIFEHPVFVDVGMMLKHAEALKSLTWQPDTPTTVRVINIKTGKILSLKTQAFMFMHHINSFEYTDNGDDVIAIDFVTYPDISFMASLQVSILTNERFRDTIRPDSMIRRFHVNLATQKIKIEVPLTQPGYAFTSRLDMPAINENFRGKRIDYVYGVVLKSDGQDVTNVTLVKKDLNGKRRDLAWFKTNHYPTEPWFVPKPHAKSEDDGLLLSLVMNGRRKESYIGVFDAKTMRRINRVRLPSAIPMTLHGRFVQEPKPMK